VKYGVAVVRNLVDKAFCDEALNEIRRVLDEDQPLNEWTVDKPGVHFLPFYEDLGRANFESNAVLEKIFDQPRLRAAFEKLHGGPGKWDGVRNYTVMVKPYDPNAKAEIGDTFHEDFGTPPPAILYRGFNAYLLVADTEPFSGNFMCKPGSHIIAQRKLIETPEADGNDPDFRDAVLDGLPTYEFVGKAGDVLFWHHLLYHDGNRSHSENRLPRVAVVGEVYREKWLTEIDADRTDLSPWERSLAQNGSYKTVRDEAQVERHQRAKQIAKFEAEHGVTVDDKWKHYSDWPG
jgi:hypothetical protein